MSAGHPAPLPMYSGKPVYTNLGGYHPAIGAFVNIL